MTYLAQKLLLDHKSHSHHRLSFKVLTQPLDYNEPLVQFFLIIDMCQSVEWFSGLVY